MVIARIDEKVIANVLVHANGRNILPSCASSRKIGMNEINRSMGLRDTYPFVISPAIVDKLSFIFEVISSASRKDVDAKRQLLGKVDVTILCLPDEAARQAATLIDALEDTAPRVIDASSAHRVAPGWVFGFPEYEPGNYEAIAKTKRLSNPGCYSTGFLALIRPYGAGLISAGP